MTDIKALFFDIDGTLVSFRTHRVPDSAMQALREARSRGVKIFISTGRPLQIMDVVSDVMPLTDGCVTCNGAYCFVGRHTVSLTVIERRQAEAIVAECQRLGRACFLAGTEHSAFIGYDDVAHSVFAEQLAVGHIAGEAPAETVMDEPILQITPFFSQSEEQAIMPQMEGCMALRWHPAFVDVVPAGVDKAHGVELVARHIGIDIGQTMAFGDGGNDISMLQKAGVGVAMGNSLPEVKAAADHVTSSVDDDGIANALRHYGVI